MYKLIEVDVKNIWFCKIYRFNRFLSSSSIKSSLIDFTKYVFYTKASHGRRLEQMVIFNINNRHKNDP